MPQQNNLSSNDTLHIVYSYGKSESRLYPFFWKKEGKEMKSK